jgi:hypothetical protein
VNNIEMGWVFAAEGTGQNARVVLDIISIICRQIPGLNSCHGAEGSCADVVLSSSQTGKFRFEFYTYKIMTVLVRTLQN